jgi:hypothetical protein
MLPLLPDLAGNKGRDSLKLLTLIAATIFFSLFRPFYGDSSVTLPAARFPFLSDIHLHYRLSYLIYPQSRKPAFGQQKKRE